MLLRDRKGEEKKRHGARFYRGKNTGRRSILGKGKEKGTGGDSIEFARSACLVIGSSTRVQVRVQVGGQTLWSKTHDRMGDHLERTVALKQNRPPSLFSFPGGQAETQAEQDRCRPRKAGPEKPGESPEEDGKYTSEDSNL